MLTSHLKESICESALAVVDVGNDAEIPTGVRASIKLPDEFRVEVFN